MTEPGTPDTASRPPLSTIGIPLRVTAPFLRQALDDVLDQINPGTGVLHHDPSLEVGHGFTADVRVLRRGTTRVSLADDRIEAELPVKVLLRIHWRPAAGPFRLPFSLPAPLDLDADYRIRLQAHPVLDTDYRLRLNATFEYQVDRPLGIERFGMGLTFSGASRAAAEQALSALAEWINSDRFHYLDLREQAGRGWQALQRPVNLSRHHEVRLDIQPEGVFVRPFTTAHAEGCLELAVSARLHGTLKAREDAVPVPLPPLSGEAPPGSGISVALPLTVSFAALEDALQENVLHHPWHIDGRAVLLRAVRTRGDDEGRLAADVSVSLAGNDGQHLVEAELSASGRPTLDVDGQHLALRDFRYDMHTDSRLLNIASTLLRPFAGAVLEPWLSLPLQPQAERLLEEVNARLSHGIALAGDIALYGQVNRMRLAGLRVDAEALRLTVETHGELLLRTTHPGTAA